MAKKTAAKKPEGKKPRRRLKRTARRSLAAVLMITAVVVAAIPVPENRAEDSEVPGGDTAVVTDVHKLDGSDGKAPYRYDAVKDGTDVTMGAANFSLSTYAGKTDAELVALLKANTPGLYASYYVADPKDGVYTLGWQFMYYEVTDPRGGQTAGAICKYNKVYYTEQVNLSLNPDTEFFTASVDDVNKYYAGTLTNNNTTEFQIKDANGKVTQSMDNDPTKAETVYTYSRYTAAKGMDEELKAYLAKYPSINKDGKLTDKITEYQNYQQGITDGSILPGTTKPDPFTIIPAQALSEEEKLKYFCEHNNAIKGSGYTLVGAKDNRPGEKQGDIYLAQGGTVPEGSLQHNDKHGILVLHTSDYAMCAIADKAFYEVTNIKNINIPEQIGYIGDDAFARSKLEGVTFENVSVIGNRAFKDCVVLSSAMLELTVEKVGEECFSGTKIQSVKFGSSLRQIGYGAFYNCRSLTSVAFEDNGQPTTIDGYAFYNCPSLTNVEMQGANIVKIGDGAFASDAGSQPMGFTLPEILFDPAGLGNYLFAGRSGLKYVVFPKRYGSSTGEAATVPPAMFHGCSMLEYVEFPSDPVTDRFACGYVSYDEDVLFADVLNEEFYVRGPEVNEAGDYAKPRQCTWIAKTAVSEVVPYVYKDKNGNDCYEVSDGYYLLCIDNKGVLTSCMLSPKPASTDPWDGILEIPAVVAGKNVVSIAPGCFGDSELNENVVSLKIADGSIQSIAAGVFKGGTGDNKKDWLKLKKVYLGNSVKEIGDSAFEGCDSLIDVTFSSPAFNHADFKMGKDAFKTGSSELTFHGDIVAKYAPFEWAMDPDNIIDKDLGPESQGIRVCYKSMAPTFVTVMYNPITDMVTMLDYPKYDQIETILADAHDVSDYNRYREQYLYNYYMDSRYDDRRIAFANAWNTALTQTDVEKAKNVVYASENYGPWVNTQFITKWQSYVSGTPGSGSGTSTLSASSSSSAGTASKIMDWLFEPLTVYAADNPDAYYAHEGNAYDVHLSTAERGPYRPSTPEEDYLLYAVQNIVVPEGVESIDVYGYVNDLTTDGKEYTGNGPNNSGNESRYFTGGGGNNSWDINTKRMYTAGTISESEDDPDTAVRSVPGLFSGYYKEPSENNPRGNDTIRTVTMNSVKYLPDYAFDNCEQLQSVVLGKDCADIGTAPFRGCTALRSVSNNDYYETDNGIIYSKASDGSYVIEECFASRGDPDIVGQGAVSVSNDPKLTTVSAIREGAFEDCDVINSVNFGNNNTAGLAVVPKNCFKDCEDLQTVVLPMSVNDIESGAFAGSNHLSNLTIYGKEVKISGQAFDGDPTKSMTNVRAYKDSAVVRYVKEYGTDYRLQLDDEPLGEQWQVTFVGPDYSILELEDKDGKEIANPQYVADGLTPKVPKNPVLEGWTFDKWVGLNVNGKELGAPIEEDTIYFAQGYSNSGMVGDKFVVEYMDSIDGSIFATQYVTPGEDAPSLMPPSHPGFIFVGYKNASDMTNIQKNTTLLADYKVDGTTNISGGTTNTSGGTTNTSGGATNTSTTSSSSNKSSSSSSSSSSTSTSSTTSGANAVSMHRVTVVGGSGSGTYATGATVVISANEPAAGMKFTQWTTESSGVTFNQMTATSTMFVMPENDVLVVANFEAGNAAANPAGITPAVAPVSTTNNDQTEDNGNTRVDISKPGISNKDLATANVNGSTDNFVIKISETDEATKAVAAALTNKYGTLDNILYYAMDITLWDSTGSYQLTGDQLNGISVDITIPIPDSLVAYGGNNMAGAVINGDQLESLNENFTTINGVPCVRFQATHFSPYTIYVDTGNLVEGMLDTTPQTGDPIHPKWFLSLGLACLSIILFLKRDKKTAVKVKAKS